MTSPNRTRKESRAEMEAAILRIGRAQLAEKGPAGLSLREVARTIGVASSAVYRYVASRDDLLTRLLVDAYTSLADQVDEALDRVREQSIATRLIVLGCAMRGWAIENPSRWALIYGSPVPGYAAPAEVTVSPGVRVMARLMKMAAELSVTESEVPDALTDFLTGGAGELGVSGAVGQEIWALRFWCTLVGAISMEVFGQFGPGVQRDPELGELMLRTTLTGLLPESA